MKKTNEIISPTVYSNQFDEDKMRGAQQEQDLPKPDKLNFVENFKTFLAKRFSVKSSSCNESKQFETSMNQPSSPFHTSPLQNGPCNNGKCSPSSRWTSIESYQRIIQDYKECLPKDFTIRHFPHSSCSDTFENANTTNQNVQNINEKLNSLKLSDQQGDTNASSHSSSQSTSPSNGCLTPNKSSFGNLEPSHPAHLSTHSNTQLTSNSSEPSECNNRTNTTQENSNNQRFYHVFKRNELDCLIQTHCANLIIYNSYYDHGNWCICATKTD